MFPFNFSYSIGMHHSFIRVFQAQVTENLTTGNSRELTARKNTRKNNQQQPCCCSATHIRVHSSGLTTWFFDSATDTRFHSLGLTTWFLNNASHTRFHSSGLTTWCFNSATHPLGSGIPFTVIQFLKQCIIFQGVLMQTNAKLLIEFH